MNVPVDVRLSLMGKYGKYFYIEVISFATLEQL